VIKPNQSTNYSECNIILWVYYIKSGEKVLIELVIT
jgi:hypothetical protein